MSKILEAFQRNKKAIRQIIAKYRSNFADIDEVSQDVFLTAFAIELKEEVRAPDRLLMRIAKHLAIDQARKKINKTSASIEDSIDLAAYADEKQISPEDILGAKEKLLIFSEAIAQLKPELRQVFVMRRIDELKYDQIATRLNVSKSSVEKRMAAAMKACEAYFKNRGYQMSDFSGVVRDKRKGTMKTANVVTALDVHESRKEVK